MSRPPAALLSAVELEPERPAEHAVIWLHGLGADGHDFPPIVPELRLDPARAVRWVFPHAPAIPVTLNGGMVMPAFPRPAGTPSELLQELPHGRVLGCQVAGAQ